MEKIRTGWLVTDGLTAIPNTRTFWHDLLDWFPNLIDKTGGNTPWAYLPINVEREAQLAGNPDYIIRNCTYFRRLNLNVKTYSLLQDIKPNTQQIDVANHSDVVVCNTRFTYSHFKDMIKSRVEIIPLGVNSEIFTPQDDQSQELGILPNSILFVGAANNYPKGFDLMLDIINKTNHNFCLVMKDGFSLNHPRVRVFNRVSQEKIAKIYNSCKMIVCTSRTETQHLVGIEGGFCGIPTIATNVGIYYNLESGEWGRRANNLDEFKREIEYVFNNPNDFNTRDYFLREGYDVSTCKESWTKIINETDG